MSKAAPPGVHFAPRAFIELRRGINLLANLVRPTLGPGARYVAVEKSNRNQAPDLLDEGARIARRVIQLSNPYVDMGAMLLRHTLWEVQRAVGDGTATTAVLMQTIVNQVDRYLAAGGQPVSLRLGLERGLAAALGALDEQVRPVDGAGSLMQIAEAACQDSELAALLGEIFEIVGPDGYVQIRKGRHLGLDRQYIEGVCWEEGYCSTHFVTEPRKQEVRLESPAILISDFRFSSAEQLVPMLDRVATSKFRSLLIIAQEFSSSALSLLVMNNLPEKLRILAVKAPSHGAHQAGILEDIAVLTGGRVVTRIAGERAEDISLADLGLAHSAWATATSFGILGGRGDPVELRRRIAAIKASLISSDDPGERKKIRERLGKLLGGMAILWIGGATTSELSARKARAERAVTSTRLALAQGVVPGGGVAYLNCRQALRNLLAQSNSQEQLGIRLLERALEGPLAVIAQNGGHDPSTVVTRVKDSPLGWGWDSRSGTLVDMWAAGIVDPLPVSRAALEAAVSGAAMAFSTDVLVHRRSPKMVFEP